MSATKSSNLNERGKGESQPVFSYFEGGTTNSTPFINNELALWVLVFGINASPLTVGTAGGNDRILVTNAAGTVIDAINVHGDSFGAPASGFGSHSMFIKKMLIPPGGQLQTSSNSFCGFQAIKGKFEDVIKLI